MGIGYLSAQLKAAGFNVRLLQIFSVFDINDILDFKPDVICYSLWTGGHNFFYRINKKIKTACPDLITIAGGPHSTFCTDSVIADYNFDYVIRGEADYALPLLCKALENRTAGAVFYPGTKSMDKRLVDIKEPPQDLDKIKEPDRKLLYSYRHNLDNPIRSIMSSRGCPYSCTFCYNEKFKELFDGKKLRLRNMEMVIEEAKAVRMDYPQTEYFFFQDDELGGRKDRLEILAKNWMIKVKKRFHAQLRVEYINNETIKLLKFAGCNSLTFAIESGNSETRKTLGKRFSNEQIETAVRILHKHKMKFRIENMLAIPFSNQISDMWDTYNANKRYRPALAWASLFQPYPGTTLGKRCQDAGLFSGNVDDIPDAFFDSTILKCNAKSKLILENMQKLFTMFIAFRIPKCLAKFILSLKLGFVYKIIGNFYKERMFGKLFGFK